MRLAREYGSEGIVADKADDAQTLGAHGQVAYTLTELRSFLHLAANIR